MPFASAFCRDRFSRRLAATAPDRARAPALRLIVMR
jgi:hypothetical protein